MDIENLRNEFYLWLDAAMIGAFCLDTPGSFCFTHIAAYARAQAERVGREARLGLYDPGLARAVKVFAGTSDTDKANAPRVPSMFVEPLKSWTLLDGIDVPLRRMDPDDLKGYFAPPAPKFMITVNGVYYLPKEWRSWLSQARTK